MTRRGRLRTVDCNCLPWHYRVSISHYQCFVSRCSFRTSLIRPPCSLHRTAWRGFQCKTEHLAALLSYTGRYLSELPLFLATIYSFCNTSPVGLFTLPCRLTRSRQWIVNEAPSLKAAKFTKPHVVEAWTKIQTRTPFHIRQFIYYSL